MTGAAAASAGRSLLLASCKRPGCRGQAYRLRNALFDTPIGRGSASRERMVCDSSQATCSLPRFTTRLRPRGDWEREGSRDVSVSTKSIQLSFSVQTCNDSVKLLDRHYHFPCPIPTLGKSSMLMERKMIFPELKSQTRSLQRCPSCLNPITIRKPKFPLQQPRMS